MFFCILHVALDYFGCLLVGCCNCCFWLSGLFAGLFAFARVFLVAGVSFVCGLLLNGCGWLVAGWGLVFV